MVIENTKKVQVNQQKTRRHHWLSLLIAVLFALMVCPSKAPAQIIGNLEVNIPFQFHAGNAKLPPGKYIIHMLDNSDLTIMEISSADGSTSALFSVQSPGRRGQFRAGQERIDLQQIREPLLPCEGV